MKTNGESRHEWDGLARSPGDAREWKVQVMGWACCSDDIWVAVRGSLPCCWQGIGWGDERAGVEVGLGVKS